MSIATSTRVAQLRRSFDGEVLDANDPGYEDARRVWNAKFDRRPTVIVRPRSVAAVQAAVRFGREQDLEIAVRGGGQRAQ